MDISFDPNSMTLIPQIWREYLEHTPDFVFMKDRDLRYLTVSRSFARFLGFSGPEALAGKTDFDVMSDPANAQCFADESLRVLDSGSPLIERLMSVTAQDGTRTYLSSSTYPIITPSGTTEGVFGIIRNISDKVCMSVQALLLKARQSCYRTALQNVSVSVWEYNHISGRLSPGAWFSDMFPNDCTPEMLAESGIINPEYVQEFLMLHRRLLEGAAEADGIFLLRRQKDGPYWYEHIYYTNLFDSYGKPYRSIGVSVDVSERYRAQQGYEREIAYLLELKPDTYLSTLLDVTAWRFVQINYHQTFSTEDFLYDTIDQFISKAEQSLADESEKVFFRGFNQSYLLELYGQGRRSLTKEFQISLPEGDIRWVRLDMQFLINPLNGHTMLVLSINDIDDEKRQWLRVEALAQQDSMTGLFNYNTTIERIKHFLMTEGATGTHALFMIDIDNFKTVNDTFGHQKGDTVLVEIANAIKSIFRSTDIVGRVGGDEFLALMKNIKDEDQAVKKGSELLEALEYVCKVGSMCVNLSGSIGICVSKGNELSIEQLHAKADRAMYAAKAAGKNLCIISKDGSDLWDHPEDNEPCTSIRLHSLLEHMDGAVLLAEVSDEIKITYASPSCYKAMGHTESEIGNHGENYFSVVAKEDLPNLKKGIFHTAQTGSALDFTYRVFSGGVLRWRHVRATCLPQNYDAAQQVIMIITDITALKSSYNEPRALKEHYPRAVRSMEG